MLPASPSRSFPTFPGLIVVLLLGALAALGCGSGGQPASRGTPTPHLPPDDASAIRGLDLEATFETQQLLQRLGSGRVDAEAVLFADLTGDRRDEAIVPITSDGTLGNIAYLVFTLDAGDPKLILTRTMDRSTAGGLMMTVEDGNKLLETVGVYGDEDPLCCPSELRKTSFRWDGTSLQVDGEVREKQEPGPKY